MKGIHRFAASRPDAVDILPLVGVLSLLLACVGMAKAPKTADEPKRVGEIPLVELMQNPDVVLDIVSEERQLPIKEKTPVLFQVLEAFEKTLAQANSGDEIPETALSDIHVALAFSNMSPMDLGEYDYEQDTGVAGYYDLKRKTIVMLRPSKRSVKKSKDDKDNGDNTAWVLAHEVGHALQAQHFPAPDFKAIKTDDGRIAARAVFEGDAMVALYGYLGRKSFIPLKRMLNEEERSAQEEAESNYRKATGSPADFDKAPLMYRERTLSPYRDGLRFMSALYRVGGFDLTNRVFSALPSTMEQVLHPEKYLQGEPAVTVEAPPSPEGFEKQASGTLGELLSRAVMDQCLPAGSAERMAAGWGGDAFTLSKKRDLYALLWSTQWDTAEDAAEFEEGALRLFRCWKRRDRLAQEDRMFEGKHAIRREGQRVVLAYGVPEAELEGLVTQMLTQEVTTHPSAPPLGAVSYIPLPDLPKTRPPYIMDGRFINERLMVEAPIPKGFKSEMKDDWLELLGPKKRLRLWLELSERQVTPESVEETFEDFRRNWTFKQVTEHGEISTPLGAAFHQGWGATKTERAPMKLSPDRPRFRTWNRTQISIIPICNKQGSIVLSAYMEGEEEREQAKTWLNSVKYTGEGERPICAALNP